MRFEGHHVSLNLSGQAGEWSGVTPLFLGANPACIYRGHGVYAWGATLDQAYKWSSSVEAAARIAWLARIAGVQPKR